MSAGILADLARAKAVFQLRALTAIITEHPTSVPFGLTATAGIEGQDAPSVNAGLAGGRITPANPAPVAPDQNLWG